LLDVPAARVEIERRMASTGGIVRSVDGLRQARDAARDLVARFDGTAVLETRGAIREYLAVRDAAITHHTILAAMAEQIASEPGVNPCYVVASRDGEPLGTILRQPGGAHQASENRPNRILETRVTGSRIEHAWVDVRPVPDTRDWFEAGLKLRSLQ
jgi:hypothetical protein